MRPQSWPSRAEPRLRAEGTTTPAQKHAAATARAIWAAAAAVSNRESDSDTDQVALRVSRRENGTLTQPARILRFPAT